MHKLEYNRLCLNTFNHMFCLSLSSHIAFLCFDCLFFGEGELCCVGVCVTFIMNSFTFYLEVLQLQVHNKLPSLGPHSRLLVRHVKSDVIVSNLAGMDEGVNDMWLSTV